MHSWAHAVDTARASQPHFIAPMVTTHVMLVQQYRYDMSRQQGHWSIVNLVGKGNHVRTVPMPLWVKDAVDRWVATAPVTTGRVFRAVSRHGITWGTSISESVVWYVVRNCAKRLEIDHLVPHDLRRTCTKLCHVNGVELEQIQFLLGHASGPDDRALLGLQAESGRTGERSFWLPILEIIGIVIRPVGNI